MGTVIRFVGSSNKGPLGNLLMAQLCWAQVVAGISRSILEYPEVEIPQIQNELWIITLREFLAKSQLRLCIPDIPLPSPRRINDKVLMDFVGHFSPSEQQRINRCRIYLKVELLSEICDASGTILSNDYYNCTCTEGNSLDTRLWPRQHQPGPHHIQTWKRFLYQFLKRKNSYGISPALGPWKDYTFFRHCQIYYETKLGWLCRTAPNGFTARYLTIDLRRRSWIGSRLTPCDRPDETWIKLNIDVINDSIDTCEIAIPASIKDDIPANIKHEPTWQQFLSRLPKLDQYMLQNIQFYERTTPTPIIMADHSVTLQIVSNGSVKDQMGTFGWIIATDTSVLFTNHGKCFGQPMTSHRAEFIGVLSWMIFISRYREFFSLSTHCTIAAHCDNLSVVNSTNKIHNRKLKDAIDPDYDVACDVRHRFVELMQYFPTTIQHIKGHQDSKTPIAELSWPAQLNVKADELADKGHECRSYITLDPIPINRAKIFLICGKSIICSGEKSILRWRWREFILQDYFMRIFNINPPNLHNINWAAMSMVQRKHILPQKFMTKLLIKWLPTGTRLKKYGNSVVCCPLCNLDEDEHHILTCPKRIPQQNAFLEDIATELKNATTKPELADAILHGFRTILPHNNTRAPTCDQDTQQAFQQQSALGWPLALRGLFVQQWSIQQEAFHPKTLGDHWQARITEFILLRMHHLWIDRNAVIHDTAINGNLKRVDEETMNQVRYLYECLTEISQHDRHELLSVPLPQRLTFSTTINSEWVKQTMSSMKRRMDNWKAMRSQGQSDLRDFISRSRPTNTDTQRGTTRGKKQRKRTKEPPTHQTQISSFFLCKTTTNLHEATLNNDTKSKNSPGP
jgi:ribonuclease HI